LEEEFDDPLAQEVDLSKYEVPIIVQQVKTFFPDEIDETPRSPPLIKLHSPRQALKIQDRRVEDSLDEIIMQSNHELLTTEEPNDEPQAVDIKLKIHSSKEFVTRK